MPKKTRRLLGGIGLVCALALGATACGGSDDGGSSDKKVSAGDIQAALKKGGSITVWAWEPTLKQVVKDFEKEHPKVHVNLVNAGTNKDQYTALQNAIAAKKGVPDVAQIEYYA
ncbi:extracellular solute-binding protein, partial [Streptomyces sp. MCAF7]